MMKKLLIILILLPSLCCAQYVLERAFPNLTGFSSPVELVNDGTSNRLFIAQHRGLIYSFHDSPSVDTKKTFLDLTGKVSQTGGEAGLLGLTFHPNYESNGYFYCYYLFDSTGSSSGFWIRLSRFTTSTSNPDSASINSELIFLTLELPIWHAGGKLAFGHDEYLYFGIGDGGISTAITSQNLQSWFGKLLRIDVNVPSADKPYSIPPSNPFYANTQGYIQEIYAYGFRNPWKFSFDMPTSRLWLGDVGEDAFEEINLIESGRNYGWDMMEGFHCYPDTNNCDTSGYNFALPVWEYSHTIGKSVTGGYVYKGLLFPELYGKYIHADFLSGTVSALSLNPITNTQLLDSNFRPVSFGVDRDNELYILDFFDGEIYKLRSSDNIRLNVKVAIEGYLDLPDQMNMRDTVRVYLHSSVFPHNVVDSSRTVIDSLSLTGTCSFSNAPGGTYYIVVKHKNSLETWSKAGGELFTTGSITNYDFTLNQSQAFGNNLKLRNSKYCIYSGDINQDGIIDAGDLSLVDNAAFNSAEGYVTEDVTGDNFVDAADLSVVDNNGFNTVIRITP